MEKQTWRLIEKEFESCGYVITPLWGAIVRAVGEGKAPNTILLSPARKHVISIGLHTNVDVYIDYDYARKHDIDVLRGAYGYGAIFTDKGALPLEVVAKKEAFHEQDMAGVYREILELIAEAISKEYGVDVRYRPLNDLEIKGRKVGGWGSYTIGDARTFYGFYQVKRADIETAEKVLLTPPEKVADKITKTAVERMASVEEELGREISFAEFNNVLKRAFEQHFDMKLVPGELTDYEKALADEEWERVTSEEWVRANIDERKLGPMPPGVKRCQNVMKVTGGPALRIVAYINPKENRIINVSITGSMHCDPRPMPFWLEGALKGVLIDENTIRTKVEELFSIGTVAAATADDYVKAIMGAVAG